MFMLYLVAKAAVHNFVDRTYCFLIKDQDNCFLFKDQDNIFKSYTKMFDIL